jgi:hypothetical protein
MASTYPSTLDTFAVTRADATTAPTTHPADHNNANDAINKIEAELGVDPSASFSTVKARLDFLTSVRKTADQTNATTTQANVTDLVFPIAIGVDYSFSFWIPFASNTQTTGIGFALTCPTLTGYICANVWIPRLGDVAATAPVTPPEQVGQITSSGDVVTSDQVGAITVLYVAKIEGVLSNASATGSLQVQVKAEAAGTVTVKKGASGVLYTN